MNDCVWYLRADSVESKQHWVDALESYKVMLCLPYLYCIANWIQCHIINDRIISAEGVEF